MEQNTNIGYKTLLTPYEIKQEYLKQTQERIYTGAENINTELLIEILYWLASIDDRLSALTRELSK